MGGVRGTQKRRRNEGDDKWGRLGDGRRQHTEKNEEGGEKRGVKGGLRKRVWEHTEKMTRGGRGGMGEGTVYLSSGYFGNMDSVLQAASFKVEPDHDLRTHPRGFNSKVSQRLDSSDTLR